MPSKWIEHIKAFAAKNNLSYGCALSDPQCRATYTPVKKTATQKKERETMGGEDINRAGAPFKKPAPTPAPEPPKAAAAPVKEKIKTNDMDLDIVGITNVLWEAITEIQAGRLYEEGTWLYGGREKSFSDALLMLFPKIDLSQSILKSFGPYMYFNRGLRLFSGDYFITGPRIPFIDNVAKKILNNDYSDINFKLFDIIARRMRYLKINFIF